jgi:hypothetical protein
VRRRSAPVNAGTLPIRAKLPPISSWVRFSPPARRRRPGRLPAVLRGTSSPSRLGSYHPAWIVVGHPAWADAPSRARSFRGSRAQHAGDVWQPIPEVDKSAEMDQNPGRDGPRIPAAVIRKPRRGGRAAEGAAFEMRSAGNRSGGSNPSLSVRNLNLQGIITKVEHLSWHSIAHRLAWRSVFVRIIEP